MTRTIGSAAMLQLDSNSGRSLDGEIESLLDKITERHVRDIAARLARDSQRCDSSTRLEGEPAAMLHFEAEGWAPATPR